LFNLAGKKTFRRFSYILNLPPITLFRQLILVRVTLHLRMAVQQIMS